MTSAPRNTNRWRAFALLAASYFMTVVDFTIVNVSLPTIGRDLHLTATGLEWVVTAYALTLGGFLLLGGRAADLLGRRRMLIVGLALFTAASLACGLARSDAFLIAGRAAQGFGGAIMLPAALSIVMNMFEEGAERNKALGIWGGLGATAGTVGLIAGGVLTRYAGWQSIFYLNVPIGAVALALAPRLVPTAGSPPGGDGSTCSAPRSARVGWCCWWTRSHRRPNMAGARPGRLSCSRHLRRS